MPAKPIGFDFFAECTYLSSLKAYGSSAAFLVKRVNLEENRCDASLGVWRGGKAGERPACGRVARFWWRDEATLVFCRPPEPGALETPRTVLYTVGLGTDEEPREWLTVDMEVDDIAFLPDGDFVFLGLHDPVWLQCLAKAGGDVARAAKTLEQERKVLAADELPIWANGEGFVAGQRHRIYLWRNGRAQALTGENANAEHLRLDETGAFAYYIETPAGGVAPVANRLVKINLATRETEDSSIAHTFRHDAFALLGGGRLAVFGSDMARYGIQQNPSVYRCIPGEAPLSLYSAGEYALGDGIVGDLKMAAEQRLAAQNNFVFWVGTRGDKSAPMAVDMQTGEIRACTDEEGTVQELALCGGELLFTALRGNAGPELYSLPLGGLASLGTGSATGQASEKRLTHHHEVLEAECVFAQPQKTSFTNGQGQAIDGWVLRPAGFAQGQTHPVVLFVHGGPKAAYGSGIFHEMQLFSALGYGVMYCNPTGGDGKGDAFADLRGAYGGPDYTDLMAFVDHALAQNPWMDENRLGVAGGSYGGFMVNWMVGHTNRFKAAVSMRGIASWETMGLCSDIGYFFVPDQIGNTREELWASSPLAHVKNAQTPTLFLHSEEDYRCPYAEALQMYSALRRAEVKTRLVLFRGENHDLSRSGSPAARLRRLREMARWFEIHLAPQ